MLDKLQFYIRHSLNDLQVNKQRTFFALLCIAAGVAAIVSLQNLAVMMNKTLMGSLQESNRGDIVIQSGSDWDTELDTLKQGEESGNIEVIGGGDTEMVITAAGINTLKTWFEDNYPGSLVTYRHAILDFGSASSVSIPKQNTYKPYVFNYFIESQYYPVYGIIESEDGKLLKDLLGKPNSIVFSRNLADDLKAEVGDTVKLAGASQDFTLTGIIPTDSEGGIQNIIGSLFGYYYTDVNNIPLFENIEPGRAWSVYVRLADPAQVDEASERLTEEFPYFNTATTTDLKETNTELSEAIDQMVVIMGLLSLLIGGIGIVNTMLVIVSRRTTEIAVLKTIGLEPEQVTLLFLVEAILMGIMGSLAGVLLGWILAYATKGIAGSFLGESLAFTIAFTPAFYGIVVGVIITAIFGFLPTLAAGQIRPSNVLRPQNTVIPRTGRLSAFVAIVCLVLALSMVTQGLIGNLLGEIKNIEIITGLIGIGYGLAIAIPTIIGGILTWRRGELRGSRIRHILTWLVLLLILPALGFAFGYTVQAIIILTGTIVLVGYLYITLWLLIWATGGGRFREIWPGILILVFPLFWPLIPLLIVLLIPAWILGRLIQNYAFIDFKIAMRAMLATKGRGASTLLALVVGVFTLSVITMMVDSTLKAFGLMLEEQTGGNVMVFAAGSSRTMDSIRGVLDEENSGVQSYALMTVYEMNFLNLYDASKAETLNSDELAKRVTEGNDDEQNSPENEFLNIEAREMDSNLPNVRFTIGRNLDPTLDSIPDENGYWPLVLKSTWITEQMDIEPGDLMTFAMNDNAEDIITFRVVGVTETSNVTVSNSVLYVPAQAFGNRQGNQITIIAEVDENKISDLRRSLADIPGSFLLETRLINDLINRIVRQFTSFPILVAALALFTGGIVIANSVALSTMERRREIGIMKAVGLQRERVLGMLLLENGLMGLVGGLIGVGISFVMLIFVLSALFGGLFGETVPYGTAFALMALCIGISLLAAMLSVWGASGEKPLNVLRYE